MMKAKTVGTDDFEISAPIKVEFLLLRQQWHIILTGLLFQYVHGIFTQLAFRMHQPAPQPLHDVGFALIPELPEHLSWVSEAIFTMLLLSFIGWSFTPLLKRRSFSTVLLWTHLLVVLVVCQLLRILSFTSTQLPGPAPHCRSGKLTATRTPATVWWQHLVVDVGTQVANSCGDLIFSSHMTFILTGILAYSSHGTKRPVKAIAWAAGVVLAILIIAARKHYTVDVLVAWYTVPMVYKLTLLYLQRHNGCCCCCCSDCSAACGLGSSADAAKKKVMQNKLPVTPSSSCCCCQGYCCCDLKKHNQQQCTVPGWKFRRQQPLDSTLADVEAQVLIPSKSLA